MKQFTLSLDENLQRPVVHLTDWYGFDAMLDSLKSVNYESSR